MRAPCAAASRNWREARPAPAGLFPGQQVGPARRLHRVLRRPRQDRARAGLGLHLPADPGPRPGTRRSSGRNSRPCSAGCRTACSSACSRTRPAAARAHRRLPRAVRLARGAARRLRAGRLRRHQARPRALPARGLLHLRHAGRHAARSAGRRAVALLRARPAPPGGGDGQKGRAYFLGRLLRDVVFNEARLASGDQKARQAPAHRRGDRLGAAALITAGGFGYGYMAWSAEQSRATRLAAQIGKAEQAAQGIPFERVTDAEFRASCPTSMPRGTCRRPRRAMAPHSGSARRTSCWRGRVPPIAARSTGPSCRGCWHGSRSSCARSFQRPDESCTRRRAPT
jgi:hypothetical protein